MPFDFSDTFRWLTAPPYRRFATKEQLVAALREARTDAIECLMEKTEGQVRKTARAFGLPADLSNFVLNDGILLLIEKIRNGAYDPEKSTPQTYLAAICRNLLANHARLKRPPAAEPLENGLELADNGILDLMEFRERKALLDGLLQKLGPPCADLIALKYLDGYTDEEQVAQKMTDYTTTKSLCVTRGRCMKKLAELSQKWKSEHVET